jgi:L-lactate dehydrogenase complex protein LldF
VKIDIPQLLVHLRTRVVDDERARRHTPTAEQATMAATAWVMANPRRFKAAESGSKAGRLVSRGGRIRRLPAPLSAWTSARDLPAPPKETFRQWWSRTRGGTP